MRTLAQVLDVAAAIVVVAILAALVRPGARGPELVTSIGNAYVNAARATVGTPST